MNITNDDGLGFRFRIPIISQFRLEKATEYRENILRTIPDAYT